MHKLIVAMPVGMNFDLVRADVEETDTFFERRLFARHMGVRFGLIKSTNRSKLRFP